jgi:hypothetical protein
LDTLPLKPLKLHNLPIPGDSGLSAGVLFGDWLGCVSLTIDPVSAGFTVRQASVAPLNCLFFNRYFHVARWVWRDLMTVGVTRLSEILTEAPGMRGEQPVIVWKQSHFLSGMSLA